MEKLFDVRIGLLWKYQKAQIHAHMKKTKIFLEAGRISLLLRLHVIGVLCVSAKSDSDSYV
jgi:hypothetical protein